MTEQAEKTEQTQQVTIYEVLGGDEVLAKFRKRQVGNRVYLSNIAWHGLIIHSELPWAALKELKDHLGVANDSLAKLLGISTRTLTSRYKTKQGMKPQIANQTYRIAQVFAQAEAVFGSEEAAREWLNSPQPGLGGQVPLELLATEAGASEVEDLLGRIKYGVLA